MWHQPAAIHALEEADAAVPLDRLVPSTERVQVYELPQTQVASVVHQGDFVDFTHEHATLLTWIEANGYRIVGPYREVYMNHNRSNMSEAATEIQYPIDQAV